MSKTVNELPDAWKPLAREPELIAAERALVERKPSAPVVTPDELDLARRTVAKDATPEEFQLYNYDCKRQGVHPLDRLLHFTKRGGKYTPVTSIDFMRARAADSGEMAGSKDAVFLGDPGSKDFCASVTVYRLTQGQRFAYAATAFWSEYCPAAGQDHMWKKMPHTMLAKCAEALALRKGFPRQLAGLYAKEELDQAETAPRVVVEAPPLSDSPAPRSAPNAESGVAPSEPNGGDSATFPPGVVLITKVEEGAGKAKGFLYHSGQPHSLHGRDRIALYQEDLVSEALASFHAKTPVVLDIVMPPSNKPYVKKITPVHEPF